MTIAEFLEARIAEDEAAARECEDSGAWEPWRSEQNLEWWVQSEHFGHVVTTGYVGNSDARPNAEHIARWDPARALAECAAKRAIVDLYELHRTNRDARRSPLARAAEDEQAAQDRRTQEARTRIAEDAVRSLAAVYSDHPDYDKDWAL